MMYIARVTTQSEPSMAERRSERRLKALTAGQPIEVRNLRCDICAPSALRGGLGRGLIWLQRVALLCVGVFIRRDRAVFVPRVGWHVWDKKLGRWVKSGDRS